ncbi:MAG: hypothetical protein HGB18_05655 [Candidatus Moranbacteria bacterium]|nr:hypothetical protein [Candidatus Moranbacteria bacterium]
MRKNTYPVIVIATLIFALVVESVFLFRFRAEAERKRDVATLTLQDIGKGIDGVRVQIKIKKTVNGSEYTDSIYYSPDEWARLSREDVEEAVRQRIESWTKTVNIASSPVSKPTIEPVPGAETGADTPAAE